MATAIPAEQTELSVGKGGIDLTFLPATLTRQCSSLIDSYHHVHGFGSLPNLLWQFRLGPLIERQDELRHILRRASTTRSAKVANTAFVRIAATLLTLEILASSFAGWSQIFPLAGAKARDILQSTSQRAHLPLMEFYLYPPKQMSAAAVATLGIPQNPETALYRSADPELSGERHALRYASLMLNAEGV